MGSEDEVEQIEALGIDEVKVRTPLTCETRYGLCAKCYGRDLGRGQLVQRHQHHHRPRCLPPPAAQAGLQSALSLKLEREQGLGAKRSEYDDLTEQISKAVLK